MLKTIRFTGVASPCCAGHRRSFFLILFLFFLLRHGFRGTVGAGADVRHALAGTAVLRARSAGGAVQRAGDPCALSRAVVEPDDSAAGVVFGAVLLRMDLPDGHAAPLLWQSEVGEQARQAGIESNRYKPWQTDQVRHFGGGAGGGGVRTGLVGWLDPFSLLVRSMGLSILPGSELRERTRV